MNEIERLLKQYDDFGVHRTASTEDENVAEWLSLQLERYGYSPTRQVFPVSSITGYDCVLEIGGRSFDMMPCYDSLLEQQQEITGTVGYTDSDVIRLTQASTMGNGQLNSFRDSCYARALVIFTLGSRRGLTPLNADRFEAPVGPPSFFISSEYRQDIKELLKKNAKATIRARIDKSQGRSCNLLAVKKGKRSDLFPIVIFTPRTGWWRCAAERGGGLACLLHVAKGVGSCLSERSVIFLITSGHELGYLGMKEFALIEREAQSAHLWLHLGANFAALHDPLFFMQASSQEVEEAFLASLQKANVLPDIIAPSGGELSGEGTMLPKQASFLSLQGGNGFFHHPDDRFPDAVDLDKLKRIADAVLAFVQKEAGVSF